MILGLLALTLVCVPFYGAWHWNEFRRQVTAQEAPGPRGAVPAGGPPSERRAGNPAPVVLAYHDVGRASDSRYTVTPESFDAQLAALASAGYRTLSTDEFVAYLDGGPAPGPRSVFLTFDDGAHGLWVHADRILAKYRMRAAAFLITRSVGSHRPYYLSWDEIGRMARSGRWDFENHTRDLHRREAVDAAGHTSSAFTGRLWLPDENRRETAEEYRRRIEDDLDRSVTDITRHGLPSPRLFAYPFSESQGPDSASPTNQLLRKALAERFVTALTNGSDRPVRPLPAGRRAAAAVRCNGWRSLPAPAPGNSSPPSSAGRPCPRPSVLTRSAGPGCGGATRGRGPTAWGRSPAPGPIPARAVTPPPPTGRRVPPTGATTPSMPASRACASRPTVPA